MKTITLSSEKEMEKVRPSSIAEPKYTNIPQYGKSSDKPEVKIRRLGAVCADYSAREKDELSLRHGSVVEVIKEDSGEAGWVLARVDKKKGLIPKDYVVLVGSQPSLINSEEIQRTNISLGSGAFAEVFRGFYQTKEVALKVPKTTSDRNRETLTREALILSRISHKNIVGFFGLSVNPLFIALEICEGGTLRGLYRMMASSDVFTVIYWARQVGEAIQHLHSREDPLVYADLKAENVLIKEIPCLCGLMDETWKIVTNYFSDHHCRKCGGLRIDLITLKLADFNVTRSLSVKRHSCSGTLLWMSPESIKDNNFSKSSDVWSFGMFLWELFSRKVPFGNCDPPTIMNAIVNKEEMLPLPKDLPDQLRIIFDGSWRKKADERPTISELLSQLDLAEKSVDSNYKWLVKDEFFSAYQKTDVDLETNVLQNINREFEEASRKELAFPLYEAVIYMERLGVYQKFHGMIKKHGISLHPPTPAKRQKKFKLDKQSIGNPCDFRHNVSARLCSTSPPHGHRTSSREKFLLIRYLDEDDNNSLVKPLHHRSHDSLIEQSKEGGQGPYCTLPKTFKHKAETKSQNHLNQVIPAKADGVAVDKKNNSLCRFKHDYLMLDHCSCAGGCRHTTKHGTSNNVVMQNKCYQANVRQRKGKSSRMNPTSNFSNQQCTEQENNRFDEERKLNRANAVRPKLCERHYQDGANSSSASCSSSIDGFVVVGECEDLHKTQEQPGKHMNLPDMFNRRISPPQQHLNTPNSSHASSSDDHNNTKDRHGRKASNEQMPNSIFYLEEEVLNNTDLDSTPDSNRPRSGRLGWVNRLFGGSSPRHSTAEEAEDIVVQMAHCFHPNHNPSQSQSEISHSCTLRPDAAMLPEIFLSPTPELTKTSFIKRPGPAIHFQKGYKKRVEPEKQNHRRRAESLFGPAISHLSNEAAKKPTELLGTTERLSMNTIIQIQQPEHLQSNELPNDPFKKTPRLINIARSCMDLNEHSLPNQQQSSHSKPLLTPDNDPLHQRSRSSENPIHSNTRDLIQCLLQPVPSNGPILNPSYVPMRDSQKEKILMAPPPIPSKIKSNAPVPLPRRNLSTQTQINVAPELPWPTSQAPVLNRPISRPDTLRLSPRFPIQQPGFSSPLTTPTTFNSLFTNSSASFGTGMATGMAHCDSGIDPEPGTEGENSPFPPGPRPPDGTTTTIFSSVPNVSPKTQLPSAGIRRSALGHGLLQTRIPPQLPTTPPPPLPPKKKFDGPKVPPIPKNLKKSNRF